MWFLVGPFDSAETVRHIADLYVPVPDRVTARTCRCRFPARPFPPYTPKSRKSAAHWCSATWAAPTAPTSTGGTREGARGPGRGRPGAVRQPALPRPHAIDQRHAHTDRRALRSGLGPGALRQADVGTRGHAFPATDRRSCKTARPWPTKSSPAAGCSGWGRPRTCSTWRSS